MDESALINDKRIDNNDNYDEQEEDNENGNDNNTDESQYLLRSDLAIFCTWVTFSVTLCRIVCIGRKTPCFDDETALWVSFSDDFFTWKSLMFSWLLDSFVR